MRAARPGRDADREFDLWTSRYVDAVPWHAVDGFLSLREREGPRIEYRSGVEADRGERVPRVVETIGAMANSGGGLIFMGVKQDRDDRPAQWPTLGRDALTTQRIESMCRSSLDPYVQVDVGRAEQPDSDHAVWVIRVPGDFDGKPVFVDGKGILSRLGEATVPAPVSQIRGWLIEHQRQRDQVGGRLTRAIPGAPSLEDPAFLMAATPSSALDAVAWGDEVDEAIERLVGLRFGDMDGMTTAEDVVDFKVESARGDLLRHVWVDLTATSFRRYLFFGAARSAVDVLRIAGEIRRTWLFAADAIRSVMPRYDGEVTYRIAVGGIRSGFRSRSEMHHQLRHATRSPAWNRTDWMFDGTRSIDSGWEELVETVIARMLRGFGYRRVGDEVYELVQKAASSASAEDPPW